ncbi:MAG: DNA primase small subunit domain-containing protein [Promethearchaeota archaeon]
MSEQKYLKRLFQEYYRQKGKKLSQVNRFKNREFGVIPWDRQIMMRHMGFDSIDKFSKFLVQEGPRHVYSSGTLYEQPDRSEMDRKQYLGCDFIIDIDVDHFYTPCKDDHDLWRCKACGKHGKGLPGKKCACGGVKFETFSWICENCLEIAKKSIISLVDNFLMPDFGVEESDLKIAFSGHRGYHIKIENDKFRMLTSESRREIADYLEGNNLSLDELGFKKKKGIFYGLRKENVGWSKKIINKLEEFLRNQIPELEQSLKKFGLNENLIRGFIESQADLLEIISSDNIRNIWHIQGFGYATWIRFLKALIEEVGVEIDEPVSIDVHRLIRYPDSLHGKSGFKVQELTIDELENFNPLNEANDCLDPIVFKSDTETQRLEIVEEIVPLTKMKGFNYGPYSQGEIIEVPNHVAIFLLCKEVAKLP